jgi:2-iminoacetate synthase ThiH
MLTLATSEIQTTEEAREDDPQRVKADHRAEMTVKELCELYMEEGRRPRKRRRFRSIVFGSNGISIP